MDFRFTQEQQQFADSLRRWVEKDYSFEHRKKIVESAEGVSTTAWQTLAELGATALTVPEEQGGLGGGTDDLMIVMQELGRGLVVEPYFATALGAEFLNRSGGHAILEQVAAGEAKLACALNERDAAHDLFDVVVTAKAKGGSYVLNGEKTVVIHGAQADALIVSARTGGAQRDTDGISLFLVPAGIGGMSIREYRTIDGQRGADVEFKDVALPASALLGEAGKGWDVLEAVADHGVVLLCAEAVGVMEAINAATLDYLKTREQFGVPIGTFQVLQHRMADMYMHQEQARAITTLAVAKVATADADERRRVASAAKVRVGQAAKFIGQQTVQMHGGMGMTNELAVAHGFKRLTAIEMTLGDSDYHLARFVARPAFMEAA
jgi:alkylation response protein AidB-like acyl-CoA dehydrogenase